MKLCKPSYAWKAKRPDKKNTGQPDFTDDPVFISLNNNIKDMKNFKDMHYGPNENTNRTNKTFSAEFQNLNNLRKFIEKHEKEKQSASKAQMNKFQIAASNYIDCGLNPLPLHAKKNPMLASGHDYLYVKHYDTDIFKRAEAIGICCGEVSDNLFCIDFDQKQGNKVSDIFYLFTDSKIFKEVSERCAMYQTPSGGYHLIFKTTYPVPTQNLASFQDGSVMIEIRGQGAYIACEPSDGYKRLFDVSITDVERISSAQVDALLKLAVTFSQQVKTSLKPKSDRKKAESWDITKPDGKYNEECVDEVKELILNNGWQYVETRRDGIEYWTRPGKHPEDGHSATFGKFRHCFYVWTKNAHPLESETAYNPFELYTIFEYGGDWKKAKDALADRFGMERNNSINEEEKNIVYRNPFPVEVFPNAIQEIISATNESLNFPIDFIGSSILCAASISIGNTYRGEIKSGWEEPTVLYLALVGQPGTNKSHPVSFALKPIDQWDNQSFIKYRKEKMNYDTISSLSKKEREEQGIYELPKVPKLKQILVADFTQEALAEVHKINLRGIGVYADELASWFKNFNRYNKGSEEQFWLSAWSGKPLKVNRKTSEPINISLPYISVIGTIQPGVLNQMADNRIENGFIDRILFVVPDDLKKEYWSDAELNPEINEKWQSIIIKLLNLPISHNNTNSFQPRVLRFTSDARQLIFEWQRELTDESNKSGNEILRGINAKIEMYAIRLSLILQLLRYACDDAKNEAIEIEAVQGAIKLAKYFKKSATKVHSIVSSTSPLDKLPTGNQAIYEALPEIFTTSEGVKIAESMEMSERTFKRFLKNRELFENVLTGKYEKRHK